MKDVLNLNSILFLSFADPLACAVNHIRPREEEKDERESEGGNKYSVSNSFMILTHLNWILVFASVKMQNSMQKYIIRYLRFIFIYCA